MAEGDGKLSLMQAIEVWLASGSASRLYMWVEDRSVGQKPKRLVSFDALLEIAALMEGK